MSISIDKPLSDILKSSDIANINIPPFQRPYSWGQEQIAQFLIDLENSNIHQSKHFYGLIVYVNKVNSIKTIDVIDGQQRLTTIIICLSILRDLMEDFLANIQWSEEDRTDITDAISNIKSSLSSKQNQYKLSSNNEAKYENEFLRIIQSSILDFKDKEKLPRKEYDEQALGGKNRFSAKKNYMFESGDKRITKSKNSFKNYITIHDYFNEKIRSINENIDKFNTLNSYALTILEQFRYIPFAVESYEQAFEYFEVLNDRGLDISALDLIKNECLKKPFSENERNEIFDKWSEIFSTTLDQSFNVIQFVRYSYMREFGHITKKQIYSSYKNQIKDLNYQSLHDYLSQNLLTNAKIFRCLVDPELSTVSLKPKIYNAIQLLRSTKTVQWYSIAMAALEPIFNGKTLSISVEDKIVELLEKIHELMFGLNFLNVVANSIETKFPEIAKSITFKNQNDFLKTITKASENIASIKQIQRLSFENIVFTNNNSFESNNDLGVMLIFLFKYFDKKSSDDKLGLGSLEHLFPQKPTETNWPIINKLTNEQKTEMTYSIGNFYITNYTLNPSLGNKSFTDKLVDYKKWTFYDILPENNVYHYTFVSEWNLEVVQKRTSFIINKFKTQFQS